MDLKAAFGPQFTFTSSVIPLLQPQRLGMEAVESPVVQEVVQEHVVQEHVVQEHVVEHAQPTQAAIPDVYLLQIHIGRDDCHLICTFHLVFIISFILSSRKNS